MKETPTSRWRTQTSTLSTSRNTRTNQTSSHIIAQGQRRNIIHRKSPPLRVATLRWLSHPHQMTRPSYSPITLHTPQVPNLVNHRRGQGYQHRTHILIINPRVSRRSALTESPIAKQYADSRAQNSHLPPLQATPSLDPAYYSTRSATQQLNAVFGREAISPLASQMQQSPLPRGQVPKFTRCTNLAELRPNIRAQPPFRRANPEGGFISVCDPRRKK